MGVNIARDWPVLIFLGGFLVFVVYSIMNSRNGNGKDGQTKNKT